jgi:DNA-binding Lrp family transcriptional regulator
MEWTREEERYILSNSRVPLSTLAARLKRTRSEVSSKIHRMRMKAERAGRENPVPRRHLGTIDTRVVDFAKQVKKLSEKGLSYTDIGERLGVSRTAVGNECRRQGLRPNAFNSRHRKKLSQHAREMCQFRVQGMLKAEAMGWPGRSLGEARILEALHQRGPMTGVELAEALGVKWLEGSSTMGKNLRVLLREGLLTRTSRWRGVYSLATGVEHTAMEEPDDYEMSGAEVRGGRLSESLGSTSWGG